MNERVIDEAVLPLGGLLDRAAQGKLVTITRQGRLVARLVPVDSPPGGRVTEVVRELRRLRCGKRLEGLSFRQLVAEGRR